MSAFGFSDKARCYPELLAQSLRIVPFLHLVKVHLNCPSAVET